MRFFCTAMLVVAAIGGCSPTPGPRKFSVFFEPYSVALDPQARDTIQSAADFASANPALPIAVAGYAAPPDPKLDVDGLSAQRAAAVKALLVSNGVKPDRITTVANGITDPKNLPNVSVRRVDIGVGQ
jgi:outer membrane protein OmpA-like peptidoglycan-associated protein